MNKNNVTKSGVGKNTIKLSFNSGSGPERGVF